MLQTLCQGLGGLNAGNVKKFDYDFSRENFVHFFTELLDGDLSQIDWIPPLCNK